jgi:hypothetical protein
MGNYGRDENMAKEALDLLEGKADALANRSGQPAPGDVVTLIKLWERATSIGLGYSAHNLVWYTLNLKPHDFVGVSRRASLLSDAVDNFTNNLENTTWYYRAQTAMDNLLNEYRKGTSDANNRDLTSQVHFMIRAGLDGLASEELLDSDRGHTKGD